MLRRRQTPVWIPDTAVVCPLRSHAIRHWPLGGRPLPEAVAEMSANERRTPDRFWLILSGVLLVTMPAFTLVVAYAVLLATQSALAAQLTAVEVVELYLIELAAFALFGYLLYRLTMYSTQRIDRSESD